MKEPPMADSSLRVVVRMSVRSGQVEAFNKRVAELTASVEAEEPRMRSYEWYLSEDGADCYFTELLADSDAFMAQLAHVGRSLEPLFEIAPISELLVLGSPSAPAREAIAGFGPRFFRPVTGFVR
jgi:quinol monooxygenase YgiN